MAGGGKGGVNGRGTSGTNIYGLGGGGWGADYTGATLAGSDGLKNTGGGGGGNYGNASTTACNGGSGFVIIRYAG
jgi:hypothetical protein